MDDSGGDVRALIEQIAKWLVDEPASVSVEKLERNHDVVLELRVAPGDLGKVIGRQGRTARSLRTLLDAASSRGDKRVILEIVE